MKKLDWDTTYWGLNIYNLDLDYNFNIPMENKQENKEWLIQALIPEKEGGLINSLEDKGFRFVETKVNFMKKVEKTVNNDGVFIDVLKADLEVYKNTFYKLFGEYSRFNIFCRDKVNDFYYLWLINSITGKMDDACIGYFIKKELAGFITYRVFNDEIFIGLFGVFPDFQRMGIGKKLLNWINNMALDNGYSTINVSTQGCNYNAINTYINNGFVLKNIQKWYYLRGDYNDTI